MKKFLPLLFFTFFYHPASNACNATFTHTYACAGDTIYFNAIDQYAVYTWDFGDTASGVANISHDTDSYHVYNSPGTFYVTLFVNIGAEWDYQTQIITVGTDCFNAAFSYTCFGPNAITFTNESTGNYTSTSWDFGDPSSGNFNTSSKADTVHTFTAPGNYTVTLISSNGILSDTIIQTVMVDSVCIGASFHNMFAGDCFQDSTIITAYYIGQPVSYHWDFGDPISGVSDTSSDSIGVHMFSTIGSYLVTLIISDGMRTDTFYDVQNIIDCSIWPGNANADGEVDMEDLFAIGIYYGDSGTARPSATTNWNGQSCADWNGSGFNFMYLQDLLDKKHADCNGDGVINSIDITSINQNYGLHQPTYFHNDHIQMMPVTIDDPVLKVNAPATYSGPAAVSIPIDLSATDSVRSVYGISVRIYYNTGAIVPGSVNVSFNNGWLGTQGIDLTGLVKDNSAGGYIDFGMVRTDHMRKTGNGTIAYLHFTLTNFTGNISFDIDPVVDLISNGLGNQEIFFPVAPMNTTMNVISTSVSEIVSENILVYPNPVKNILTINSKNQIDINRIILTDVSGRKVVDEYYDGIKSSSINCTGFSTGIYLLSVNTTYGVFNERIEIKK